MTREEQIIEASQLYAKHQQKPFMDGALWADAHPNDDVLKLLRKMFESDPDVYKQGYKDAIDKATRWLLEEMFVEDVDGEPYVMSATASSIEEFISDFKKAMEEETMEELFLCQCGLPDHMFYIKYDEEWKEVFIYVHLRKKSFWNRLKYGIKYIFGYQSRYGAFDEVILRQEDLPKLRKVINKAYQYKPVGKKEVTGVLKELIDEMKPLSEKGDKNNE